MNNKNFGIDKMAWWKNICYLCPKIFHIFNPCLSLSIIHSHIIFLDNSILNKVQFKLWMHDEIDLKLKNLVNFLEEPSDSMTD